MSLTTPNDKRVANALKSIADLLCSIESYRNNEARINELSSKLQYEQAEPSATIEAESLAVLIGYINELSVNIEPVIASTSNEILLQQFRVLASSARLITSAVGNELIFNGELL
jgi:hypothetical protein